MKRRVHRPFGLSRELPDEVERIKSKTRRWMMFSGVIERELKDSMKPSFRIPQDLYPSQRKRWAELEKHRTAIFEQIMALLGRPFTLDSLSDEQVEELEREAQDPTEAWEIAEAEDETLEPRTELQRRLAEYSKLGEEMMNIADGHSRNAVRD